MFQCPSKNSHNSKSQQQESKDTIDEPESLSNKAKIQERDRLIKGGVVTQQYWNTTIVDRILVVSVTIPRLLSIDPSKNPPNTRAPTHARTLAHTQKWGVSFLSQSIHAAEKS